MAGTSSSSNATTLPSDGYSLMGFIKDIPPLKGDNYTE
jgi:hypothetical protein